MAVTQKEIAERLSVSRALVSAALNDAPRVASDTRERILALASELGYRPNSAALQLKGGRSRMIGILFGAEDARVNFERMIHLERMAFMHGYRSMIGQIHHDREVGDARAYLDDFRARGVDVIFWLFSAANVGVIAPELLENESNVIFYDSQPTPSCHGIRIDRAEGARVAVRHLARSGRRRIALAIFTRARGTSRGPLASRIRGYLQGIREARLPRNGNLIWAGEKTSASQPSPETIEQAVHTLIDEHDADAILANNDYWGAALINALRARGRQVPRDVAVVGFDNLDICKAVYPALTSIDQCHDTFSRLALKMVVAIVEKRGLPLKQRLQTVKPKLIIRDSA